MREKIREMVLDVCSFMEENNFLYWVDFGTLLGIMRDGDIIGWDLDGDISTFLRFREQIGIRLKQSILEKKYNIEYKKTRIQIFYANEPHVDIYFWEDVPVNGFYFNADKDFEHFNNKLAINIEHVEELEKIKFFDLTISIPKQWEERLVQLYGNWKTPVNTGKEYWRWDNPLARDK